MASLTAKRVHGKTYYYARECQRVNGKPKIVRTIYLGSADDLIAAALKQRQGRAPQPKSVDITAFGDVVAFYDLAHQIGLVELLDRHLPKRHQGLSVGKYLLLAAINRAVRPVSKLRLADWYRTTALTRLTPATSPASPSGIIWISWRNPTSGRSNESSPSGSSTSSNSRCAPWPTTAPISSRSSIPTPPPSSPNGATTSRNGPTFAR